jgi:kumamolisin
MHLKIGISQARLTLSLVLFTGFLLKAQVANPAQVSLSESIKDVAAAPPPGQPDLHTPYITRRSLKTAEAGAEMEFEVALTMRNFSELQGRVAKGEHISAQEMTAKYDPLPADYAKVGDWLTGQGFKITRQDKSNLAVFARGSVSRIQQTLQTTFARVAYEGKEYTSAITAPNIPATLSPLLVGVNGLQPHLQLRKHLIFRPANLTGTNPPYLPSQIAQAYSANGLYAANITGSGQTIAIAIDTFPNTSDLTSFWTTYNVNQSINNISFIQVVSGTLPAPSGEETLDTEWSSSVAPGAKVRVYASTSLSFTSIDQVYQQICNDVTTYGINQMSMSYGLGEAYESHSQLRTDDQYFAELAAAGVTLFASSGDAGATPNSSGGAGTSLTPESPAVDPNVTGVGGTSLSVDSSGHETSEVVWNNGSGASGGGVTTSFSSRGSTYFARPSWQTGTGVPSGSTRLVPDVACAADPNTGAVLILNGQQQEIGGTSWSSPTWAGFCALINQDRATAGLSSLGLLGPSIYPLIGTANFRDVTSGNNIFGSSGSGYSAGTGYDLCTGIGVPLVQTLARTLAPGSDRAPLFTNGPPTTTGPVNVPYSFTYTASGNPAPAFAVTPGSLPSGLNLSSTGTISGTPTLAGVYTGTVTASNNVSPNATQNFTITIQQAPAITSSPPPSTATVSTAYNFTFTATGYPPPIFSVSAGALPPGLTLSSDGVISGSPTAPGVYTATIDATNSFGTDATQSISITVAPSDLATDTPTMPPWALAILASLLVAAATRFQPANLHR